jgi:hypothetical protein
VQRYRAGSEPGRIGMIAKALPGQRQAENRHLNRNEALAALL